MAAIICSIYQGVLNVFSPDVIGFMQSVNAGNVPWGIGPGAYINFLRFFYVLSPSYFTVFMTSVLGTLLMCWALFWIVKSLNISQYFLLILIIAMCIPTDILTTSIALREVWEVITIMLALLSLIQISQCTGKRRLLYGSMLICGLFFMAFLHRGLFYIAFMFIPVFYIAYLFMKASDRVDWIIRMLTILIGLVIVGCVLSFLAGRFSQFAQTALAYSSKVGEGGSSYTIFFKPGGGILAGLLHLPLALFYYWFYPFPWDIHRVKDLYGCLLGLMRLFFIIYSFYWVLKSPNAKQRHLGGALLMILLMISMIFAIGTSNYGTSMRHNILTFWGFVMLGVPGFYLHRQRRYEKRLGRV